MLWKRKDNGEENASPGKLLHYGRSELKQSDHRPVIAVIDIEIRRIEQEKREQVFYQVIEDLGPPDGTIIIQCLDAQDKEEIYDDNLTMTILQELSQIGEVILVRFVMDTMWVTFRDGQCALTAAAKKSAQVLKSIKPPSRILLLQCFRYLDITSQSR